MISEELKARLVEWAELYNDSRYFQEDPIAFPSRFAKALKEGKAVNSSAGKTSLQDVEVAAVFSAHFAWGRRSMIVRDCGRLFDEMGWRPYDYVMAGDWRDDNSSIHRTVKWKEVAEICKRLKSLYEGQDSLESLSQSQFRTLVYGQKEDKGAPNKKINMLRRWMVRNDGKVDLGLWISTSPAELLIPLDVHVYNVAAEIGLTERKQKNIVTVKEITDAFNDIFPGDPCKGDFSLFGYGVNR